MHFLKDINFPTLIAKEQNSRIRIRPMALFHIHNGANRTIFTGQSPNVERVGMTF
jgi:hypothetical protein